MKCPDCGTELVHDTRDIEYEYKGQKTVIDGMIGEHCNECGESILERESGDRYMAAIVAFNRQVNDENR